MADIATLGLEVRSDQVDKGAASLNRLSVSAKRAEVATARASHAQASAALAAARASDTATKADIAAATAAKRKTAAVLEAARAAHAKAAADHAQASSANAAAAAMNTEAAAATKTSAALKAANSNVHRMGGSMSGLAAQFQDVGVTAAAGMSPLIIGLQQGTQIAGQMEMALQSGGSAASVFGAAIKSLLSPVSLLSIGITVLLAAGLQMVDWAGAAAYVLNGLADVLVTIAPYAAAAGAALALLYAPAIIGGIAAVTTALWGMVSALGAAALAFAAANPALAFVIGITAAVAAANIFRDELTQIFGVDIVGAAKGGVNSIIGTFVGAYAGIVATWGALPAAIGDLGYQAADRFYAAFTAMLRNLRAQINSFIAGINSSVGSSIPMLGGGLIGLNPNGTQAHIGNPFKGAAAQASGAFQSAFSAAQGKDYVGMAGNAVASAASAGAAKLRELATSFTSVGDAAEKAGGKAGGAAKKATDPWKGLREVTDKTAEEMAKFDQSLAKGFLSTLRSGLAQGKSFLESFGDAAMNVLNKIADKLEDMFVESLFSTGGSGGGGGLFGALLGGIGSLFGFARGGYTGGGSASSVAGVVHGGEYVFSKKATDRIGVGALDQLHGRAKGYASGGYVTPAPRITPVANQNGGREVIDIRLTDDSGRMADIADKQIQTRSGAIVQISVQKSQEATKKNMPGYIAETMERHG